MKEFTESKFILDTLLLTDYKFFVHIKHGIGFGSVRKQDMLVFPNICAMCGSEVIYDTIGIGRPQLYLFTNVGHVPYCWEHYRSVSAVHEHNTFMMLSIFGVLLVACMIGVMILGPSSTEGLQGFLLLIGLPSFIFIRYFANRRFRKGIGLNEDEERLILPVSIIFYISMTLALAVAATGYFTKKIDLYIASVLMALFGFAYDQAKDRTEVDKFIEANKIFKDGAAQILVIRSKFYSMGFVNSDFYKKFIELNQELIISSITYHALLQKRNVL